MRRFRIILLLFVAGSSLSCRETARTQAEQGVFSLPDFGLLYTPPSGMIDKSSPAEKEARDHAGSYAGGQAELLLDMSSGPDDTASDWHQIWIFIYPRGLLSNLNESEAEAKMNTALAGQQSTPASQPHSTILAGHTFTVSDFERKELPVVRHARIFTTTCKTQLVSFAMVSNSPVQLAGLEESLKTLDFSNR